MTFEPPTPHHLTRVAKKHTGQERFHVHQLRQTFAYRRLEAGGSPAALQQILGHASIVTTQRYARLSDAHVQAEAERLDSQAVAGAVAGSTKREKQPFAS